MFREVIFVVKYLLGKDIAGASITVFPDDMFLVSYPRSGNSWVRFLAANLMHPEATAMGGVIDRVIPDLSTQCRKIVKAAARPRLIKSHQGVDPRFRRVMYLVRDPRDVCVSHYQRARKEQRIEGDCAVEEFAKRFVCGEVSEVGSWGEHVGSWLGARHSSGEFMMIRYEDLVTDRIRELARIASFLRIETDEERLTRAWERSIADRADCCQKGAKERAWVAAKEGPTKSGFVGPAEPGGWRRQLPHSSVMLIESSWGPLMKKLRYELTTRECIALEPPFFGPIECG
jgi:Sulfotransferase domain